MKQITYSELNDYILRLPSFSFEDRIIINFHIENAFDIESIIKKIQSVKGVKKVEVFQPIRIKWIHDWLNEELDTNYIVYRDSSHLYNLTNMRNRK